MSGEALGGLRSLDPIVMEWMNRNDIPNGTVGVLSSDGRLVMARGYTNLVVYEGDRYFPEDRVLPQGSEVFCTRPHHQFRVASLSKPITSTLIFRLRDAGIIDLNTSFYEYLHPDVQSRIRPGIVLPPTGVKRDLRDITVRHLLRHTAGWCERDNPPCMPTPGNGAASRDIRPSMYGYVDVTRSTRHVAEWLNPTSPQLPTTMADMAAWAFSSAPDALAERNGALYWWPPGQSFHYSNFGYVLLGLVLEGIFNNAPGSAGPNSFLAGLFKAMLFDPAGMESTQFGRTTLDQALPDEVPYYSWPEPAERGWSRTDYTGPGSPQALLPYGGSFSMEIRPTAAGVVTTVPDLLRYLKGVTLTLTPALLPVNDDLMPLPATSRLSRPGLRGAGSRSRRILPTAAGCAG